MRQVASADPSATPTRPPTRFTARATARSSSTASATAAKPPARPNAPASTTRNWPFAGPRPGGRAGGGGGPLQVGAPARGQGGGDRRRDAVGLVTDGERDGDGLVDRGRGVGRDPQVPEVAQLVRRGGDGECGPGPHRRPPH